jgi:hypothetical protein
VSSISAPPIKDSSEAQGRALSTLLSSRRVRFCGFSLRSDPCRSKLKIDIRRNTALAADEVATEIVFECETRQGEFQELGVGGHVAPPLGRVNQARRHAAGQTRILGWAEEADSSGLLEHKLVAAARNFFIGLGGCLDVRDHHEFLLLNNIYTMFNIEASQTLLSIHVSARHSGLPIDYLPSRGGLSVDVVGSVRTSNKLKVFTGSRGGRRVTAQLTMPAIRAASTTAVGLRRF